MVTAVLMHVLSVPPSSQLLLSARSGWALVVLRRERPSSVLFVSKLCSSSKIVIRRIWSISWAYLARALLVRVGIMISSFGTWVRGKRTNARRRLTLPSRIGLLFAADYSMPSCFRCGFW
jgi:hypothetical protein